SVSLWRSRGVDIVHVLRSDRTGYKAGALKEGLKTATGEFIAIFDDDFVPRRDFLRRVLVGFTDDRVGVVQARWGHLNRNYSLLTRAQAVLLDGHFMIEHTARNRSGRFFNFNGTAGVWRRACLEDAGGRGVLRPPRRRRSRGAAGGDQRVQVAAASLGEGLDPDGAEAGHAHSRVKRAAARESRGGGASHGEPLLPAAAHAQRSRAPFALVAD